MTKARLTGACETSRPFSLTDPGSRKVAFADVHLHPSAAVCAVYVFSLPSSFSPRFFVLPARSPKMDFRNSAAVSSFSLPHHPLSRFNEAGRKDKRSAVNISGNAKITVFLVYSTASERKVYCLCDRACPFATVGEASRAPRHVLRKKRRRDDSHLFIFRRYARL